MRTPVSIGKVGVFDSGLGGLTVLKELLHQHDTLSYIYFGDTAHVPYGDRQADDVVHLVTGIAKHLVSSGCQGLVLACNTSSALAISALRASVEVPVMGVIEVASRDAVRTSRTGRIVVLANPLTARSGVYSQRIRSEAELASSPYRPEVLEIGCPDLVPIVEKGEVETADSRLVLENYAKRIEDFRADTVILGCTHYPLLLPVLGPMLGNCSVVNPATLIPRCLENWRLEPPSEATLEFQVSGPPPGFEREAARFLGVQVNARRVVLTETV